jgi:hypothetical protein
MSNNSQRRKKRNLSNEEREGVLQCILKNLKNNRGMVVLNVLAENLTSQQRLLAEF